MMAAGAIVMLGGATTRPASSRMETWRRTWPPVGSVSDSLDGIEEEVEVVLRGSEASCSAVRSGLFVTAADGCRCRVGPAESKSEEA